MAELEPKDPPVAKPEISKGDNEPEAETAQPHATQPPQTTHPIERPQERPPQRRPETPEYDRGQHRHPHITDWIIAGATVGMLIATVVSVVIANKQWKSMDDQTTAMQGQLAIEKQTMMLAERAWVTVQDAKITQPLGVGMPITISMKVRNSGKGPAIKVKSRLTYDIDKLPEGPMPVETITGDTSSGVIAPGEFMVGTYTFPALLDAAGLAILTGHEKSIVTWGTVTYSDIFGVEHQTSYCMILRDVKITPMSPCNKWNEINY